MKKQKKNIDVNIKEKIWKKENSKAIKFYNERVKKYGVFSDGIRFF